MDFKQIEAFISVAKYKSFSKAASTIFLSQPTISSHISTLEKELKVQLFDRTSKEVALTSAGESFLEYALDIINKRDHAISHLASFNDNIFGKLTLAASTTPCNSIVPMLIEKFTKTYSDVSFNILEQPSGEIIENILKFNCEIGIIGSVVKDDRINSFKLLDDDLVLVSSPNLGIPEEINIEDILKYKFILREINSATRKSFEKALMEQDIDFSKITASCEVNSLHTLLQFVKSGLGVSIVSKEVCADYVKSDSLRMSKILNLELKRSIYLITSSKRTLTPTANAFFDLCKEYFKF